LKNCSRGEGNKHVLQEYPSLARNVLRNTAKMCFSFNLAVQSKPGQAAKNDSSAGDGRVG